MADRKKALITDLGDVVAFFDHTITARALAGILGLDPRYIIQIIEQSGLVDQYVVGQLDDEEFYQRVMTMLDSLHSVSFKDFAVMWGNIFILNEEMLQALQSLRDEMTLVLISNTNNMHFNYIEEHFPEIIDLFDGRLVLSHKVGFAKPDERIFRKAREVAGPGVEFTECLYIDDIEEYVKVAEKLGMTGHVYSTQRKFEEFLKSQI